jgi:PAS domain S-box-containing protein
MRFFSSLGQIDVKNNDAIKPLTQVKQGLLELTNLLPDAVVIFLDDHIEYVNPAGMEMIGAIDPSEIIGRHKHELTGDPESIEQCRERNRLLLSGEYLPSIELKVNRLDGEEIIVDVRSVLINYKNKPAILTVSRDITESKIQEEKNKSLIDRNLELDAFAHTIAHNLKNELGVLMGYSSLIEKQISDEQEEFSIALQEIARTSHKMAKVIDELLLLSSVRNRKELTIINLDMENILNEAINRLRFLIEEHHAELILPKQWPTVLGHGPWIEEIWVNYISNAIKYGGNPPVIEVGFTRNENKGISTVTYWIKDNGKGLSQSEQDKLFKPYMQLNPANLNGHGLGLSIVKRISEKINGQVGVESSGITGEGCKFYLTLPTELREAYPNKN